MYKIELEIPDELAERLTPYKDQLPELLELGLQVRLEGEQKERETQQQHLLRVLAASGKVELPQPYAAEELYERSTPVPITGKPISEIVIEQRESL